MKNSLYKRVLAVILSCILVISITPIITFAEDTASVSSVSQLENALSNDNVKYIHITTSIDFKSDLITDKTIIVDNTAILTWTLKTGDFKTGNLIVNGKFIVKTEDSFVSRLNVYGPVENNGSIEAQGGGNCFWHSPTTGEGVFTGTSDTYIDYGTMPDEMLPSNCKINIMKDISQTFNATVTLDESKIVPGETLTPMVSNLIDGVEVSEVFNVTWKNPPITAPLSKDPTYTVAAYLSGQNLKVSVSCKTGYAMVTPNDLRGSIDSQVYVVKDVQYQTLYVDGAYGSDANIGSKEKPLKTITYALNNINDNGTIILLSDYYSDYDDSYMYPFYKNVTVKSGTSSVTKFISTRDIRINDDVTITFENIDFGTSLVSLRKYSSQSKCTGNVVFDNVTGSKLYVDDVKSISIKNSNLGGDFKPSNDLSISNSTFSGDFSCDNFVANGSVSLLLTNSIEVNNNITVETGKPVSVKPADLDNGYVVVKLPDSDKDGLSKFVLNDTDNGKFTLKYRNISDGPCLVVTEKAEAGSPFHIGNVPEENSPVSDNLYVGVPEYYCAIVNSAVWSGYTDVSGKTWQKGDIPELTIVLNTDFTEEYSDSYYFDDDFDPSGFTYYDWADVSQSASKFYKEDYIISGVKAVVKDGQGASNDGRNFTFTLVFPEIGVTHNLVKFDYKAPKCTEKGNIEYWYCSECGKYFINESATKEITLEDTVIPATGHSYVYSNHVKESDGTYLVYRCSVCGDEHKEIKTTVLEGFMQNFNKLREDVVNGYLYDVNYDGYINSRDHAIIQEYHKISK